MKVTIVTRKKWYDLESLNLRPGPNELKLLDGQGVPTVIKQNAGGGMVSKYLNVRKACPDIHFTDQFNVNAWNPVVIVEPLIMHGRDGHGSKDEKGEGQDINDQMEALAKFRGLKLLWAEEQEVLRWIPKHRDWILEQFDGLLACNVYQKQLLQSIAPQMPVQVLYTPIDATLYKPLKKQKRVIGVGKIGLQKNSETLIEFFSALPDDVETMYIGNAGLWGNVQYQHDLTLEKQMSETVDVYIESATASEVAEHVGAACAYLNMSIYDVGCLSFLEAATAGCPCFCWDYHLMFDEYPHTRRFRGLLDGLPRVLEACQDPKADMLMRKDVMEKHSYDVFRHQLQQITTGAIFNETR